MLFTNNRTISIIYFVAWFANNVIMGLAYAYNFWFTYNYILASMWFKLIM